MDAFDVVLYVIHWMVKNPGKTLALVVVILIIGHFM